MSDIIIAYTRQEDSPWWEDFLAHCEKHNIAIGELEESSKWWPLWECFLAGVTAHETHITDDCGSSW